MKNWKILFLTLAFIGNEADASPKVIEQIAAIVNNSIVLESDIKKILQSVKIHAQQSGQQLPDTNTLRHQILDRLIMDSIILQMAKKINIQISDAQLDKAINNIAAQHNITLDQLKNQLVDVNLTYKTYRNQIRKEIIIAEVKNNEINQRFTIIPQEVDALVKQLAKQSNEDSKLNLSQIQIPLAETATQQQVDNAEHLANFLVKQLKNGVNFSKLVKMYSSKIYELKNSQMGWKKLQEIPSLFAERMAQVEIGQVIGPIRSGVGFHILRVNDIFLSNKSIFITEVHARHIFLKPSVVMNDSQAQDKLNKVAQNIRSGITDFEVQAKQISQDPSSANQNGDLGWITLDIYEPSLRDALLKLRKGEISVPIHSSFGWHLIQLLDTRQVDKTDLNQKERAYRILFNRKFYEESDIWMHEQRANAYVKILHDSSDTRSAQ